MGEKLISIIMPTYNRTNMIENAIDSILKQNYSNYEIIIVNDCSTEDYSTIIKKYNNEKIKYFINEKNSGAGITRKNGYYRSKGEFIIFMDDDDYYTDSAFFSKCVDVFNKESNISFVAENTLIHYEDINKYEYEPINLTGKVNGLEYLLGFQTKYMKPNSTFPTVFRRDIIDKIENMEMLNDSSIYLHSLLYGDAYILDDVAGVYRIHKSNITFNLKVDFLIDNLDEKKKIYFKLRDKIEEINARAWWHEQIDLTLKYYVNNTDCSKEQLKKLIDWCEVNSENLNIDYIVKEYEEKK